MNSELPSETYPVTAGNEGQLDSEGQSYGDDFLEEGTC